MVKDNNLSKLTFDELKALSIEEPVKETYSNEAMQKLGPAFKDLKDSSKIKDGKMFFEELKRVFWRIENGIIDGGQISVHTIIGICQLAHRYRDRVGPSRKKSFNKIIPWLLSCRNKIIKKPPESIVKYMNRKIEEREREYLVF